MNIEVLFKNVPELLKGELKATEAIMKRKTAFQSGLWMLALVSVVSAIGSLIFPESLSDVLLIRPSTFDAFWASARLFLSYAALSLLLAAVLKHFKFIFDLQSVAAVFMHMHAVYFLNLVPKLEWVAFIWLLYLEYKFIVKLTGWKAHVTALLLFVAHLAVSVIFS